MNNGHVRPHTLDEVWQFYQSDVVISTFENCFHGRWHMRVVPDADGPKNSEEYMCGLLGIDARHHILDFGCGVGVVACSIASRSQCRVRGLNISDTQIARARALSARLKLGSRALFDLYDGLVLPYKAEAFDRICFFESLCHVPEKLFCVAEMFRVLKRGGVCGGQDWFLSTPDISEQDYQDYIVPIEDSCAVRLCSLDQYGQIFCNAGFVKVTTIDAKDLYADLASSFTRPSGSPVRIGPFDGVAERLQKGNVALSNAFHRGLFTVGFLTAHKPTDASVPSDAVVATAVSDHG